VNASRRSIVLPAIAAAVVTAAVIAAIILLGLPSEQRQRKLDGVRVQDLTGIGVSVNEYFRRHKALPTDLDTLAKEPGYRIARTDPDSAKSYGYQILSATSYRLCADFTTDSATDSPDPYGAITNVTWAHGRGHQCFDRNTDKIN